MFEIKSKPFSLGFTSGSISWSLKGGYTVQLDDCWFNSSSIEISSIKIKTKRVVEIIKIRFATKLLNFLRSTLTKYAPKNIMELQNKMN